MPRLLLLISALLPLLACERRVIQPLAPAPPVIAAQEALAALDAPDGQWTWVEVPGAACADGSPTGVGVNLSAGATDVLIFMQGGGACWDAQTCFVQRRSIHIEGGYGAGTFAGEGERGAPMFDRTNPANPFKGASFVFVPYCTGDLHAGDRVARYELDGQTREVQHHGAKNVAAMLARLEPTLRGAKRVWLVGVSAGGYGVQLNYHRFVEALPGAQIHALADGAPLVSPWGELKQTRADAWSLQTPPGCAGCATDYPALLGHLTTRYPRGRFGLMTFEQDNVIASYFGYPSVDTFQATVAELLRTGYAPSANARYFLSAGRGHVQIGGLHSRRAVDGQPLVDWVRAWAMGDGEWRSAAR
jgi:hypothetical protein